MPIKDISKEEQSHLFLPGGVKREHLQLTEGDRGELGGGMAKYEQSTTTNCKMYTAIKYSIQNRE